MAQVNTNKIGLSHEQLDNALAVSEDLFQRAQIPLLVLGKTLEGVLAEHLEGDKIELGIRRRHLTKDTKGLLKIVKPELVVEGDWIKYEVDGVPVEVRIINKNYKFLERPNKIFYWITEYLIPNPVKDYLKIKHLIA